MPRESRKSRLVRQLMEQLLWIEKCGGTLVGYIQNYGEPGLPPLDANGNPKTLVLAPEKHFGGKFALTPVPGVQNTFYFPHSGNGGTAIYKADMGELRRLEEQLRE